MWDTFAFCRGDEAGEGGEAVGIKRGGEDLGLFFLRNELGRGGSTELRERNQSNWVTKLRKGGRSSRREDRSENRRRSG